MSLPIRPSGQSENIPPLDRIGGSSKIKASSSSSRQTVASSTALADVVNMSEHDVVNTSDHDVLPVPEQAKPTTGRQPSLTASPVASSSVDNRTVVALRSPPSAASVTDDRSVVVTICGVDQEDRTLEEALEEAFCPPAYDLGLDFEDPLFWPSEKVSIGLKDVKWDGPGDSQTPDAISPPIPFRSKRSQMHPVRHPTFYQGDDTGHSMIHVGTPYTASTLDSSRPSKRPRCNDEESGEEATSSASEPALPHTPKRQRQVDASAPAAVRPVPTLVPTPVFSSATAPPSPRASLASPQSSPAFAFLPVPAPAPAPAPSPTGPAATVVLVPTAVPALVLISAHVPPPASTSTPAPTQAPTRLQSGRSCEHCRHKGNKKRCAQYPEDENGVFRKNDGPGPQNPPCLACIELGQPCMWTRRKSRKRTVQPPMEAAIGPIPPEHLPA